MSVRAKFTCKDITRRPHWDTTKGDQVVVKLAPVISGSEENASFYEATPAGEITLGILNATAGDYFELGKQYYVDFTKSE